MSNPNNKCVHAINFARCIVEAVDNDQYASPNSNWSRSVLRNDPFGKAAIAFYPNPVADFLTIESKEETDYNIVVYNWLGQQIDILAFTKRMTYNVSDFEKGVYLLEVIDDEGNRVQSEKLIVQ